MILTNKIKATVFVSMLAYALSAGAGSQHTAHEQDIENPLSLDNDRMIAAALSVDSHRATYLNSEDPELARAYQRYQQTGKAPVIKTKQFLQFPFGEWQPIVACQPIRACDIELQAGEKIWGVYLGDTSRWMYEIAMSGDATSLHPHLIFKPKDDDISTNLIVTTNLRTYHLGLVSDRQSNVLQVKFYYPDDLNKKFLHTVQHEQVAHDLTQEVGVELNAFDFNYTIDTPYFWETTPKWLPVRIFNNGKHVYIQMPNTLQSTDAPSLFVYDAEDQMSLVNYRVRGSYYIVDQLFDRAVMVSGVGHHQQCIELHHYEG
jgi:P-type conjugative transfer protein TrbG